MPLSQYVRGSLSLLAASVLMVPGPQIWGTVTAEKVELHPALGWNGEKQSFLVTSLAARGDSEVWVGTEDKGVWRYSTDKQGWTQFTTKDGLGDNDVRALATDKQGRVWAGHRNRGVSVWNGEKWKNYGLLDGPLGDRIFAIAVCPKDGDVWMGTDCGLARYSVKRDEWDDYTVSSGLPSNQIQTIAFDTDGDIFVGTQCDGIAAAVAKSNYSKWTLLPGSSQMPGTAIGPGLPSTMVNSLIVAESSKSFLMCATPLGIASFDPSVAKPGHVLAPADGSFIRGADWEANVRGLTSPVKVAPAPAGSEGMLLKEDWVNCLAQANGKLYIGYRRQGFESRDLATGKPANAGGFDPGSPARSVRGFLFPPKLPPLVAFYGGISGGLKEMPSTESLSKDKAPAFDVAPLPSPVKPPDVSSIAAISTYLDGMHQPLEAGDGEFFGDDWQTGGDWVGRYGHSLALLCGLSAPTLDLCSDSRDHVEVKTGPHTSNAQGISNSYFAAEDAGALYDPLAGRNVNAEISDAASQRGLYPSSWQGPDLHVVTTIPAGLHCVSLYFNNFDVAMFSGSNQFCDYLLELRQYVDGSPADESQPPLARTRVTDFTGGVYKQFILHGPGKFLFLIHRNRSLRTNLQGVFIEQLSGVLPENPKEIASLAGASFDPPAPDETAPANLGEIVAAARGLWGRLDGMWEKRSATPVALPFYLWAYRAAARGGATADLLASWRQQIELWVPEERPEFKKRTAAAWKAYSAAHPDAAKQDSEKIEKSRMAE